MLNHSQIYAIYSFVVALLVASLVIPQAKHKNIATLSAVFWYSQSILFSGVRAWIWSDNVVVRYEIFCDISE